GGCHAPAIPILGDHSAGGDIRGRRVVRVGARDAGARWAAGLGVARRGPAGTGRDDRLPERAVGPYGDAARLGASDSGATPRRPRENLARGPSAIRFGAVENERGDQRSAHAGATDPLCGPGTAPRPPTAVRRRSAVGGTETTTLRGEVLLQREPKPESKEVVRDGRCRTGSLTEGPVLRFSGPPSSRPAATGGRTRPARRLPRRTRPSRCSPARTSGACDNPGA